MPGVPTTVRLRWQGLFYEGDSTQLYYVRARWYDPVTHRFLTQDPIGLAGGLNPYSFAGNDPINRADPSGQLASDDRGVCSLFASSCGGGGGFGGGFGGGGGGGGRPLREDEIQALGTLCSAFDCRKVRVHDDPDDAIRLALTTTFQASITLGWNIFIAKGGEGNLALLVHEATHIAQWHDETWPVFYIGEADRQTADFSYRLTGFLGSDIYDPPNILPAGRSYSAYTWEQQADIVSGCYRNQTNYCSVSPYTFPRR